MNQLWNITFPGKKQDKPKPAYQNPNTRVVCIIQRWQSNGLQSGVWSGVGFVIPVGSFTLTILRARNQFGVLDISLHSAHEAILHSKHFAPPS